MSTVVEGVLSLRVFPVLSYKYTPFIVKLCRWCNRFRFLRFQLCILSHIVSYRIISEIRFLLYRFSFVLVFIVFFSFQFR